MIQVAHLTRRFGDRLAVDDVSFRIGPGQVFGLLGPNGAGKTSTMRMLAGLIRPSSGEITVAGLTLSAGTSAAVRSRVGILTEAPGLWEKLSAHQNLMVHARLFGVPAPSDAVERHLRLLDLWERRDDAVVLLSKGMRQKLALARALVHDPPVVLLDEPTAGLDPKTARTVRDLILTLRGLGRCVLVSTHNLDEAERLSDLVGVLQGRLVALDSPEALRRRLFGRRIKVTLDRDPGGLSARLASVGVTRIQTQGFECIMEVDEPERQVPQIVRLLVEAGAGIRRVAEEHPPLEQVYLKLLEEDRPQDGEPSDPTRPAGATSP